MRLWQRLTLLSLSAVVLGCGGNDSSVPFKALDHYLGVRSGDGYTPLYIKGVNLGVGLPGAEPGELALDYDTYFRWFERMGELGVNTVRVYTLHFPRFYEALFAYNNLHPNKPLYVLQNVWLEEDNPTGGFDLYDFSSEIDRGIEEVVSAVHGDVHIPHRLGRAFGSYEVDASKFVIAWILGRETYGGEILKSNFKHPEITAFSGDALSLDNATPAQVWAARRLDKIITFERSRFGTERPVAISNWPTTDPLEHYSEPHYVDRGADLEIIWDAGEDDAVMDMSRVDTSRAPAGLYASYHVYPYYPNFIYRDPAYVDAEDAEGPNNYIGYLEELKDHYGKMPLLISEFGMPSSWGNAHDSNVAGFHHGGHDEAQQADIVRRLGQNVYDAGCAGGVAFSWMDEWWKRTWIVNKRTFPVERVPLWMDVSSPEENYGLIAFDLGVRDYKKWPPIVGFGRIQSIKADYDASYFHLKIDLSSPLVDGERLTIGYDTYDDSLGESILPGGIEQPTLRSELSLVITTGDHAKLYVTEAYNPFGVQKGLGTAAQVGQSIASDGAPWKEWWWITNLKALSDDGEMFFPRIDYEMGNLRVRAPGAKGTSLDAVFLGDSVEIRIPWVLLQFSDPSQRRVLHDDLSTKDRIETVVSEGIAVSVALDGELYESTRFKWQTWDEAPPTFEREKPSLSAFESLIDGLPDSPSAPPRLIP